MTSRRLNIDVREDRLGFGLVADAQALVHLADAVRDSDRVEVDAVEAGVITVELSSGLLVLSHAGRHVFVTGARSCLDQFAETLRFIAAGPDVASSIPYHAHIEHYLGHPWLAADSEPAVITLVD
ncbi:MAG: hypothetical protein JHC95_09055 [Solirubrobacteraceae bacterium]|nr:hypothetical protein [Solirubrobacteraceae bacterium]